MINKTEINGNQITKCNQIMKELKDSINLKKSFGLIRFGDGTIKAIHSFLFNDVKQLKAICIQEGIPFDNYSKIIDFWVASSNYCNYIDCPEVYFSSKFWKRTRKNKQRMTQKTYDRLKMWKELYKEIGIINQNYCNPEINFLSCIKKVTSITLPELLVDKKICCISSRSDINKKLPQYDISVLKICNKFENQFENSFYDIIEKIERDSLKYDIWLVSAGELGRIYPGLIKMQGGRAFDIGSLIDIWCNNDMPVRLKPYIKKINNSLNFDLTVEGLTFLRNI